MKLYFTPVLMVYQKNEFGDGTLQRFEGNGVITIQTIAITFSTNKIKGTLQKVIVLAFH